MFKFLSKPKKVKATVSNNFLSNLQAVKTVPNNQVKPVEIPDEKLNLKNISPKKEPIKLKAMANTFADSFSHLSEAKKQASINSSEKEKIYDAKLLEAVDLLKEIEISGKTSKQELKIIANLLLEANEIKKSKAEPYYYLAYIFNLDNNQSLALRYLQVAKQLNKDLSGIELLQNDILTSF